METPPFSNDQLAALRYTKAILSSAGLSPQALSHSSPGSTHSSTHSTPTPEHSVPPSTPNTSMPSLPSLLHTMNCPWLACTIVEYPQTGEVTGARIAHIFNIDTDPTQFTHPKSNFQYSLSDGHSGCEDVVKA
ncbi:hypothetical protein PAXRUDRAFT_36974 [Paxillus rubicundulus Ve08.2h10]|uniref:Unplaced genomic scaffold scaffold_3201, whole genome shotgun sequence n=1 Tax=Paxillus rubicundulus Ve08.2h10 TaxID=930991 RepID=A0A0D0CWT3_9AGAM|nr:hypothetical protein PAXRUDRAFT_36974 [Paxillus rubicundulus Ve08.2h10]